MLEASCSCVLAYLKKKKVKNCKIPLSRSKEGTKLIRNPAGCWCVPQKFSLLSDRFMLTEGCVFFASNTQ